MVDVVGYLESKDIDFRRAPNNNVRTLCFFHGEEGEPNQGRLYIQVDPEAEVPGLFFCHVCEEKGTLNKIRHYFGDGPISEASKVSGRKIQCLNAAAQYYHERLDLDAAEYLTVDRGLSAETVERMKFGLADGKLGEHLLMEGFSLEEIASTGLVWDTGKDFFKPGWVTIPYFDQTQCIQIRGRDRGALKNKYKTPPGQDPVLFNMDTLLSADQVVLTEGEFDAAVLEDQGYHAVGVPGARAFQQEWAKHFSDTRRVFIAFDNDDPGKEGAERISTSIGSAKTRIVEMPKHQIGDKKVDVTEFFLRHQKEDFDALLRKASSGHLLRIEDAYEAWLKREGDPNLRGLKFGYSKLDVPIMHGMLPGQVVVVLARTGTGKTIMMINFMQRMVAMNPDVRILFVSLEQTRNEYFERARRIHGFYNDHLVPGVDLEIDTMNYYRNNLLMVDKNRLTVDELRADIVQAEDELGGELDLVVVDYLGYWARAFKGEPYVRTSDAIMALKEVAKDHSIPIISPHQVNRSSSPGKPIEINDARESGVIEETADIALSILNTNNDPGTKLQDSTGEVFLEVLKSRNGGLGVRAELQFAPVSLAMVPGTDEVFDTKFLTRAKDELQWLKGAEFDYGKILEKHRTGDRSVYASRNVVALESRHA